MTSWNDFAQAATELTTRVEHLLASHKHHTIATVRRNGAPRISGTEVQFADGQLSFAKMSAHDSA